MRGRPAGRLALALVTTLAAGAAFGGEALETCGELRWTGVPAPKRVQYAAPLAKPAPAVLFEAAGEAGEWSRPVRADLSAMDSLAVRLAAPRGLRLRVRLKSGAGFHSARVDVTPGEQTIMIPLGAFERDAKAGELETVDGLALALEEVGGPAAVHLLEVTALARGEAPPADGPTLYSPATRANPVAAMWPIRAIVSQTAVPPRAENAAQTLSRYVAKITGVTLPVNPKGVEPSPDLANVALVGAEAGLAAGAVSAAEVGRQGWQGFVVRAGQGRIVIAGQNRHGTAYGVYRFLERQGCAFYAAGCEETPEKTLLLRACELAERPFFDGKRVSGPYSVLGQSSDVLGDPRQAEDPEMWKNSTLWIDHTAPYLVPIRTYYDEHPDYFALRADGKRLPKETTDVRVMICTTHPDVLRISAERALRWIEMQKDRAIFSITQGDDHEWCACPRCKAMVYEPGNYSDAMLYWVNHVAREVAKKHPDKILLCHAYGPTQPPPVKLRPEKNVQVLYAAWPNATSAPCGVRDFDAPENVVAYTEMTGWLKTAPGCLGLYDYNMGSRYTLNGMAWKVKWSAKRGMRGFWYCGVNLSFRDLFVYVHARLNWDPFQDVEPLKRRFIRAFYGPAAPVMEKVISGIYDRIEYGDYDSQMHGVPPASYFTKPFVEETLRGFDEAVAALEKAGHHAAKDVASDRSLFVQNCVGMTAPGGRDVSEERMQVFGIALRRYLDDWQVSHDKAATEARAKGKKPPSHDELAATIWNWTRVRLGAVGPEGQPPERLAQLRADPAGTIRAHRVTDFIEKTADGWRAPGEAFEGGRFWRGYNWKCEPRDAVALYGAMTEFSTTRVVLNLKDAPPEREGVMEIGGQDCDKAWCAPPPMRLLVNGRPLVAGANPFPKQGWAAVRVAVPKGLLRQGENVIEFRNLANSDSLMSHWFMISDVRVSFPTEAR